MTLSELLSVVRERRRLGAAEGTVWPSGATSAIIRAKHENAQVQKLVGNLLDHWDQLPADIATDPGCDGLRNAIEAMRANCQAQVSSEAR